MIARGTVMVTTTVEPKMCVHSLFSSNCGASERHLLSC